MGTSVFFLFEENTYELEATALIRTSSLLAHSTSSTGVGGGGGGVYLIGFHLLYAFTSSKTTSSGVHGYAVITALFS